MVGSPIEAGIRLYEKAMASIAKKREAANDAFRQRELLAEPSINYLGINTKSTMLL